MIHLDRAQLGLMGLDKGELAKAEQEYKLAVSTTDHPDPSDYYRMGEACRLQGKLDDAIAAFTKASELGQGRGETIRRTANRDAEKGEGTVRGSRQALDRRKCEPWRAGVIHFPPRWRSVLAPANRRLDLRKDRGNSRGHPRSRRLLLPRDRHRCPTGGERLSLAGHSPG